MEKLEKWGDKETKKQAAIVFGQPEHSGSTWLEKQNLILIEEMQKIFIFQSGSSLDPDKDCNHLMSLIQWQRVSVIRVLCFKKKKPLNYPPEASSFLCSTYLVRFPQSSERLSISLVYIFISQQ